MRRYVACWIGGDTAALPDFYADDVVMHHQGAGPLTATTEGKDAFFEMVGRIFQLAPDSEVYGPAFVAVGDGFAVMRVPELFRDGEHRFHTDRVVVYRIRDERIAEIWTYDPDQAGMAAFFEAAAARRGV